MLAEEDAHSARSAITKASTGLPRSYDMPTTALPSEPSVGGSVASADDALEQGSVNRLRLYRVAMLSWCFGGLVASTFMPGLMRDRVTCWVGVLLFVGSYLLRNEVGSASERIRHMFPVAIVQALGAVVTTIGLGLASPFNGLIAIGLILYGLSAPRRHTHAVYFVIASSYAVLSGLMLADVIPGTGLLAPLALPFGTQLANALWIEATLATGFAVGLYARRDSARLVAELERVVRDAAHREALLREARDELARAARIGGRGAFTDVDLGGFHLGSVIGRGGMGEVYAATRTDGKGGEVAVKLLRRDVLAQPDIVRRFEREARIVASLRSDNVVAVLDVGGAEAPLPFIAMERLRGEDLVAILRARPRLDTNEVLTLVREVSAGLRAAHRSGIVHRDLKPANLFHAEQTEGRAPVWKILDFGVSKLVRSDDGTLTTNEILGTPHYMAPEQASGGKREVDARADLYSLGAIVYRALTGKLAFPKADMSEVIQAVLSDMPEDPRRLRDLHEDVALWLRIALAKRPEDRFHAADEMSDAFAAATRGELGQSWCDRARELTAAHPWGTSMAPSRRPAP